MLHKPPWEGRAISFGRLGTQAPGENVGGKPKKKAREY